MNTATILALIKAIPAFIGLLTSIANYVRSAKDRGIGAQEAVAAGLELAAHEIDAAAKARDEAVAAHQTHSDDSAFDPEGRRPD